MATPDQRERFNPDLNGKIKTPESSDVGTSILIVDGNSAYTDLVKIILETSDIPHGKFHVSKEGQEGIDEFLKSKEYDLVITGLVNVDGERVAREVKKAKPQTVVMMVTAAYNYSPRGNKDIDLFLKKPFFLSDFETMFERAAKMVKDRSDSKTIVDFTT